LSNFSKEFYHWLAVCGNEAQRFSYELCGGKETFLFLSSHVAKAFCFDLYFFARAIPTLREKRFCGHSKYTLTLN
jgi:hypothetical protein